MAWAPCLRCDQRFSGEAQNLYLTWFQGDEREAYRFVVCPECADVVVLEWRQRALYKDLDGSWSWHDPSDEPVPRTGPSERAEGPQSRRNGSGDLPWDPPRDFGRKRGKSSDIR